MAKKNQYIGIPTETVVDVVATMQNGKIYIFEMKIIDFMDMDKKNGVKYKTYQKGFYSGESERIDYKKK